MVGISEVEINGVKRGFKFGTYQLSIVCDIENCSLTEISARLKKANLTTVLNVLFAAAKSYCKSNKLPDDFDVVDVADWIDELGLDKGMELINKGLKAEDVKKKEQIGQGTAKGKDLLLKTA